MNKRQYKKACKKVIYPLVDEMNLLTLSPEEYKEAMEDFHKWVQKHCRYKHYKDKYKKLRAYCYHFPVGAEIKHYYEKILSTTRKYEVNETIITQSISKIKEIYGED